MISISTALVGKQVRFRMKKQAEGLHPPLYLLWQECERVPVFKGLERQSDFSLTNAPIGIYCDFNKTVTGAMVCPPTATIFGPANTVMARHRMRLYLSKNLIDANKDNKFFKPRPCVRARFGLL